MVLAHSWQARVTAHRKRLARAATGRFARCLGVGWLGLWSGAASWADLSRISPDLTPGGHIGFETAELLPPRTLSFYGGTLEGAPGLAGGLGRQYYGGEFRWRGTGRLEYGLALQAYDDPPRVPIGGGTSNITTIGFGPSLKYQVYSDRTFSVSAQTAVEMLVFASEDFGTTVGSESVRAIGSLQFPATMNLGNRLQIHGNLGVSLFPETLNGNDFFGTFYHGGFGLTWAVARNLQFYANAQDVFGPGGNAFASDGSIAQESIWSIGGRYAVSRYASADLYLTNGVGFSPATALLADFPTDGAPLFGVRFNYLPGANATLDGQTERAPSPRAQELQVDGLGLNSGHTLLPGTFQTTLTASQDGNWSAYIVAARDPGVQFEALVEDFANDGSVDPAAVPEFETRLTFGGRMRLFVSERDQPLTVTARLLAGRDLEEPTTGVFYGALPITYEPSDRLAIHLDPRFAAFGSRRTSGIGLGINYRLTDTLKLLAEATAVSQSQSMIWNVGTRYDFSDVPLTLELFATNAMGRYGLGGLVAQDSARLGIRLSWLN